MSFFRFWLLLWACHQPKTSSSFYMIFRYIFFSFFSRVGWRKYTFFESVSCFRDTISSMCCFCLFTILFFVDVPTKDLPNTIPSPCSSVNYFPGSISYLSTKSHIKHRGNMLHRFPAICILNSCILNGIRWKSTDYCTCNIGNGLKAHTNLVDLWLAISLLFKTHTQIMHEQKQTSSKPQTESH